MPTVEHIGVSRKIESDAERLRLRRLVNELRGSRIPGGFIVRTAGENHPDKEIEADVQYLSNLWEEIRANYEKASAPALVHSELGLVERIIRDHLSEDFKTIRVDDELEYERILDFVNRYQGSLVSRIKLFTKNIDIFDEFGVNAEIRRALEPKIWLKSGGYIVINQTEALVAIDVNTGKFVGKGDSLEETITKTNLEAVKEVVRQVRLRDLGGIIVIDFIDMEERKNRHRVMDALQQEITKDKAPSKVLEFNEFGLVAITRKRVKQSLEKVLCQACPYCGGSGMVKSITTVCYQIHGEIQKMAPNLEGEDVAIRVHPEVAKALRNGESKVLSEIETLVGHEINIKQDETLHISHFDIII
jgi:ribonuclease G